MAAPRGRYIAPAGSPFPGRAFAFRRGDKPTAPYNRYLQARAKALGFSGYSEQRRLTAKANKDDIYLWALQKTLQRRFDLELEYGSTEVQKAGRRELAQKVGDAVSWSKEEGIQNMSYRDALLKLYTAAVKSDWETRANGPYARFLELIGIREERATYDVGDTPTP